MIQQNRLKREKSLLTFPEWEMFLNQFLMPAMSLSVLLGSMVSKWSLMAIYRTPY